MALFKIQVFKSFLSGGREWTNVYLVTAADLLAAGSAAFIIKDHEILFHKNQTIITKFRVTDETPGSNAFVVVPVNEPGTGGNAVEYWPLFNVVRVDFQAQGFGRPSRKYYRLPLIENDVADNVIDPARTGAILTALSDMIADLNTNGTPFVDPQLQLLGPPVVFGAVQMRQLHRKRRRPAAP